MPIEIETMVAETIRRKQIVTILGKCPDCGQPVMAGQEILRSNNSIRHVLCFYEPAYAKRVRSNSVLEANTSA